VLRLWNEDERAQHCVTWVLEVVVCNSCSISFDAPFDCRLENDVLQHVDFGMPPGRSVNTGGGAKHHA